MRRLFCRRTLNRTVAKRMEGWKMDRSLWWAKQMTTAELEKDIGHRNGQIMRRKDTIPALRRALTVEGRLPPRYEDPAFCENEDLLHAEIRRWEPTEKEYKLLDDLFVIAQARRLIPVYEGELKTRREKEGKGIFLFTSTRRGGRQTDKNKYEEENYTLKTGASIGRQETMIGFDQTFKLIEGGSLKMAHHAVGSAVEGLSEEFSTFLRKERSKLDQHVNA
ncbi:MAG: hypothetical protein ACYC5X_04785 [Syntrophales bacterium]